ncbi:MAG: DUF2332 domain-containing protein, partial [Lysinibacillus sp.]
MYDLLRKSFQTFAQAEAATSSPLYEFLSYKIADDEELLEVIRYIPKTQPKPNLFFAAVHYLLMQVDDPLRNYYPSLTTDPLPFHESYPLFKSFALKRQQQLKQIFQQKLVQTNEVRRSAYLYPLIASIYEREQKPLALIEIGSSAGLLLALDHYNYRYNNDLFINLHERPFTIQSVNNGNPLPVTMKNKPEIKERIGIDLNVVDLQNPDEYRWMQALIWPEHEERRQQFTEAKKINDTVEKVMLEGDAIQLLPKAIQQINNNHQIVIFHTHVANQLPKEVKESLIEVLKNESKLRPLYHIYNNLYDMDLHQDYISHGEVQSIRILPKPDGHARSFHWK